MSYGKFELLQPRSLANNTMFSIKDLFFNRKSCGCEMKEMELRKNRERKKEMKVRARARERAKKKK